MNTRLSLLAKDLSRVALLGALLCFAAAPAWAANCARPPRDVGDNLEFFGIYAALDSYSDNYCAKKTDAGWLSIQQMLDNLPRFSGPEDGTGTNLWNPPTPTTGPLSNCVAYALSHHGLCTETQYPLRQVRLVTATLGDGPTPDADTDTYQFPGTNGAALAFELTPDSAQFGHTVTRPGDAILTLLAPDGTSVVKRARSLLPVQFTATLPRRRHLLGVRQPAGRLGAEFPGGLPSAHPPGRRGAAGRGDEPGGCRVVPAADGH